ncbi:hypothetical protein [Laceyella putida]|uniref:Flagellar basal body rod protein n=1 Tax=Laceyella putida TaxID=110101 RepID=A0ABW2RFV3_9BACL
MKKFIGLLLLVIGVAVFIGDFGALLALLVAGALMIYGVKRWKRAETKGKKAIAFTALGVAAILLLHWAPSMMGLLIGGVMLYLGWKLLKGDNTLAVEVGASNLPEANPVMVESSFEADWQAFLNKQNQQG